MGSSTIIVLVVYLAVIKMASLQVAHSPDVWKGTASETWGSQELLFFFFSFLGYNLFPLKSK